MKIQLTEPGFDTYNGQMGVVFFENGASLDHVSPRDALRISGSIRCRWIETGVDISPTQHILENADTPAPNVYLNVLSYDDVPTPAPAVESIDSEGEVVIEKQEPLYTQEQLESVADAEGISGLRKLADPVGIKGRSVGDLITALIKNGYATPTVEQTTIQE